ncbi:MAG: RagB/SusD family nutrient uptake outer membrane protein [Bacteroidales bacterium]|nr:RagB/SusD family nutrient uptake outer membrane protein [Bacteroidales bacterium]
MKKILNSILLVVLVAGFFSCNKSSLDPTLAQQKIFDVTSLSDIEGLLNGALDKMTYYTYYGRDYIIFGEVRSDDCFANGKSGRFLTPAAMDMGYSDAYAHDTWLQMYSTIANLNIIIAQDPAKLTGDAAAIKNVIGEAYALRALVHFDLLKLYGQQNVTGGNDVGIPYVTTYRGSDITPARNTVAQVHDSINADLAKALTLMSADLNSSPEYVTTDAVYALQSRVALYFGDWAACKTAAEEVINSGNYSIIDAADYPTTFTNKSSVNIIFELAETSTDNQGINGLSYIYRGTSYGDIQVVDSITKIFDPGDVRASADMLSYNYDAGKLRNVGKYPTVPGYDYDIPLIRYEEVVLNYAEALYRLNPADPNALVWLNKVPANRGANLYTSVTEDNILQERQRELCFEGFRFDDLARTQRDIPLVEPLRQSMGTVLYGDYKYAFPIPIAEINANPNVVQNKGY